jgi:hypothetical protein
LNEKDQVSVLILLSEVKGRASDCDVENCCLERCIGQPGKEEVCMPHSTCPRMVEAPTSSRISSAYKHVGSASPEIIVYENKDIQA